MTGTRSDVQLPAGAESAGDWGDVEVGEPPRRVIYGERLEVGPIVTGAWAGQQADGFICGNDGHDVFVDEMVDGFATQRLDLSIAEARQLAAALLSAASTAEGCWLDDDCI